MNSKILHISTNDFGGAGSAALRIHETHMALGLESHLLVKNQTKSNKNVYVFKNYSIIYNLYSKIKNKLFQKVFFKDKYLMYSAINSNSTDVIDIIAKLNFNPDFIFLHWVAGFLNNENIQKLTKKFPNKVYWFMMDMAPITGGCHFSFGCQNYKNSCQICPADVFQLGIPKKNMDFKKKLINDHNLRFITPNKFVKNQLPYYLQNNTSILYIPINEEVFFPSHNKNLSEIRILFGSKNIKDSRKGLIYFIEMLKNLEVIFQGTKETEIIICIPGKLDKGVKNKISFKIEELPHANNDNELSNLYREVNIFVCCSLEDSGPMMVTESLLSGLPVLSFEVGICTEIIKNNYNGAVVPMYDVNAMAKTLHNWIKDPQKLKKMSKNARISAIGKVSSFAHFKQLKEILI